MAQSSRPSSSDIDRKALRTLVGRVRAMHEVRRQQIRAGLSIEGRIVVDALPVLVHSNHAALPGFIDFDIPAGIEGYAPDVEAVAATRKLALSYTFERFKVRATSIQSLILEPVGNRLNAWVIAAQSHHEELIRKLAGIERHARDTGLDLTMAPLDALDIRAGRDTALGTTPKLALDRIYRHGIVLAGRLPIWWLVPPAFNGTYPEYCERLRQQRFIKATDTVDLGAASPVPVRECVTAGTEALAAALDEPYAWLARLLLIESYLEGYGTTLANRFKARVQEEGSGEDDRGRDDADLLDQLDGYLTEANDPDRLELLRVAALELNLPGAIRRATDAWGFTNARLAHLANRDRWRFSEWLAEDARIARAFTSSLSKLRARARTGSAEAETLTVLAARLDRSRRTNTINPALLPQRWAPTFTLQRIEAGWCLRDEGDEIVSGPRLVNVALWAQDHRIDPRNLTIQADGARIRDVRRHFARLLNVLTQHANEAADAALLILNAEENPGATRHGDTATVLSDYDDALDFSGFRANLLEAVDYIDPSHGTVEHTCYRGNDGIVAAIGRALFDGSKAYRCVCVDGERARAIEARLLDLIRQGRAVVARGGKFAHSLATGIAVYQRAKGTIVARLFDNVGAFSSVHGAALDDFEFDPRNQRLIAELMNPPKPPRRPTA